MNIFNFELYIFDLDGTILNTEYYHYSAYKKQAPTLTYTQYQEIFHDSTQKQLFILKNKICKKKKEKDFNELYKNNFSYVEGFLTFLNQLILKNKEICVVTDSSKDRCNFIKSLHPELINIKHWITKDDVRISKPNNEGFLTAISYFNKPLKDIIIFEDSYTGYQAIENINVSKVFIGDSDYVHSNKIKYTFSKNYNKLFINEFNSENIVKLQDKINLYNNQIIDNVDSFTNNIELIYSYFKNKEINNIYFIGVGKSNLIMKKTASSWKSIGIPVNTLDAENLYHGEFGIFKDNDLVIFVSNSGNTIELLNIARHLDNNFKVLKIIVSTNRNNKLKDYCNLSLVLTKNEIIEADNISMVPSISSVIFLMFFDLLGIKISEENNITKTKFKMYHPGGDLGKVSNKKLDFVVISCCGKGTRLYPITKDIPKFLINIENRNFLKMMIDYWKEYTDNFIIINDKKYNNIIHFYTCSYNNLSFKLINVDCPEGAENAYTLQNGLSNICDNKKIVITWCDILPQDSHEFNDTNIIFTYKDESRYYADSINNQIIKKNNGNIVGVYYFNSYKKIEYDNIQQDLCDVYIKNFKQFDTKEIEKLIDIGDKEKYKFEVENIKKTFKTRYFNKIIEVNNKLHKIALNEKGVNIMKNEIDFYRIFNILNTEEKHIFPKIYDIQTKKFVLEKIDGKNIYDINVDQNIIKKIINKLDYLHNMSTKNVSEEFFEKNLIYEFKDKIHKRLNIIEPILNHFNFIKKIKNNETTIDIDLSVENIREIIDKLYDSIEYYFKNKEKKYYLIHGDCQFSNTMIRDNEIMFIDPRGYFGDSKCYGIKEYDFSKLIYALSGYDDFNNNIEYCFTYESNDIINLNLLKLEDIDIYKNLFIDNNIDYNICFKMMIIHWFGLAEYNKNNLIKCISSIFIGYYLFKQIDK